MAVTVTEHPAALDALVAAELALPVDPRAAAMAAAIAATFGRAARAVLFYGSCLRSAELDGQMLDFYVIVSSYRAAYGGGWRAAANRLLPPNVFPFAHDGLAAKYAVLSEADFERLNGPKTLNVSVWARFAQPSRLVWAADAEAGRRAIAAVARAAPTLLGAARPLAGAHDGDPLALWRAAFTLTYGAELRAERNARPGAMVDADPARYRAFTAPALAALSGNESAAAARRRWRLRRLQGKTLSVLRLAKASLTFAGGIDYLAWKINRHAGTTIEIRPWQRRWPLLGAVVLLPKLLRSGAVR
ncbi:hypothetical protein FHS96_003425 [Sphingomonas zeicaulis]|uniref:hypothetical protein n=1 Tax=Sphingomonas zeicaulis TaxID=1632740 RepID=UPI003D1D756B